MFTIHILYFDDSVDQFSEVQFFSFDALYISVSVERIPIEDVYKVSVYLHDQLVCLWLNE